MVSGIPPLGVTQNERFLVVTLSFYGCDKSSLKSFFASEADGGEHRVSRYGHLTAGYKRPVTKSVGSRVGTSVCVDVMEKGKIPYRREWNYFLVSFNPQHGTLMIDLHPTCSGRCADAVSERPFKPALFTDLTSARAKANSHLPCRAHAVPMLCPCRSPETPRR
jgi:hypothetical protein